jgi:hypothetical protein
VLKNLPTVTIQILQRDLKKTVTKWGNLRRGGAIYVAVEEGLGVCCLEKVGRAWRKREQQAQKHGGAAHWGVGVLVSIRG